MSVQRVFAAASAPGGSDPGPAALPHGPRGARRLRGPRSLHGRRRPLRPLGPLRSLLAIGGLALLTACGSMSGTDGAAPGAKHRGQGEARGPGVPVITNGHVTTAQQQHNVNTVLSLYEAGINEKDFEKAAQYFGPHYIQHNPMAEDGIEGFRKFIAFLKERFPQSRSQVKRAYASGDYVILHVHSRRTPEEAGSAIVDIFRLEHGKVVEHWDVIQPVPEKAANSNTMF